MSIRTRILTAPQRRLAVVAFIAALVVASGCGRDAAPQAPPKPTPVATPAAAPPGPLPDSLRQALRLIGQRRLEAARDLASSHVATHPNDARGHMMIGLTYHKADNHGAAVPHFVRARELAPDDPGPHHFLAECYYLLGDLDEARREHEAHLRIIPGEPSAHYGLGLVELEHGRLDDAEAQFRAAIQSIEATRRNDPRRYRGRAAELAKCHARLADIHFARDEYQAARDALIASTTIHPSNISAFYALSLAHRRLGEDELADRALARYESARNAIMRQRERGGE